MLDVNKKVDCPNLAVKKMFFGIILFSLFLTQAYSNISFISANSNASTGSNSSTTTLTITKPSGTASEDILIASITIRPDTSTIATPSGWSLIRTLIQTNNRESRLAIYYHIVSSYEPSSYSWEITKHGGSSTDGISGGIIAFRGVDILSPIDVEDGSTTSSSTSHSTPSVTTTVANTMLVTSHEYTSSEWWTPPSGMIEAVNERSENGGSGISLEMNYQLQASIGATGIKTADASGSSDSGAAHIIALRPASAVSSLFPIADYHFDECDVTSGFKEESGGYNATLIGSLSTESGYINNAVSIFDTSSAVDTNLDIDGVLGNKGSISFWYQSNTDWIGGGIRTLFDASGTSQYFYLTLGNDGKLYYGLEDSSDADFRYSTSPFGYTAGKWVHITATWDMTTNKMQLFVNNTQRLNQSITSNHQLGNLNTLYIGDNRSSYINAHEPSGYNGESANGLFDEFKIFSHTLSSTEVANIFTNENLGKNYDGTIRAASSCQCNYFSGILDPLEFEGKMFSILDTYTKKEFTKVTFTNSFSAPPAVFILPTTDGNNPANIRIKNVTRLGFEVSMAEPVGEDGAHVAMNVNYFAINNGVHKIGNTIIEVGSIDTKKVKPLTGINQSEDYGWESLSTKANFCDPAIVSTIQTLNNEPNYEVDKPSKPFLVPAIAINGSDINISLDKVPTSSDGEVNANETISYMVAEANIQDNFVDSNNNAISFETIKTDPIIPGWGSNNNPASVDINFVNDYSSTPLTAASKVSQHEEEPGWLRRETLNKSSISLTVDESRDDKLWDPALTNERNHLNEEASIFAFSGEFYVFTGVCQYVRANFQSTDDGFYYVDEGTASIFGLKPFEVYCQNMNSDGAIAYLPTVINEHSSHNSNFKFTTLNNDNYYDSSNEKEYFDKIRIDNYFFAHDDFLNQGFSNINLIGTPFKVDMANTTLATCDGASETDKLRIGHFSQAIKIDPKVDTKSFCTATQMKFTQIDNYYAKDAYADMTTCAQIAQNSSTQPPSGYYLLKKPKQVVGESSHIVAYCDMNPPVNNQIWTMFVALGGETTSQKSDVINGDDTCSKVGYAFFAPSSKEVMYSARNFLYSGKSEWEDYTGTVREYFNDHGISGWATDDVASILKPNPIPDGVMWPYGSFGIYKSSDGASGSDKKMAMSTDFLTSIDITDGFGSLDATGWKSVLPEIDSSYSDSWWVADIATGYKRDASGHLVSMSAPQVEPSGDYDANNWLGWFADTNGYIVHYNDQSGDNRYSYSNYMCMSKDMYVNVDLDWNTWGFDAWDTTKTISQRDITTKIVSQNFDLSIASLNETNDGLQDFNGTVCVKIVDDQNISYNGDGTKVHFNGTQTQNTTIPLTITSAIKDARVYLSWRELVDEACPLYAVDGVTLATDNFAIRPKIFSLTSPASSFAGEPFILGIQALEDTDNPTTNYNETKNDSFEIISKIGKSGCTNGTLEVANFSFLNGLKYVDSNYSENGEVNITISEILGNEFAKVDEDDTSELTRLISPVTQTIVISPYELNITDADFTASTGQNWLYDANVTTMNVTASATVQANNKQHQALQNFTSTCYANDVDLSFFYTVVNPNTAVTLSYLPAMLGTNESITDINKTLTISASSFTTSNASLQYSFNVDRIYSNVLNPIDITLSSVKVASTNVAKDENNVTLSDAKRLYYGRVITEDISTNKRTTAHSLHVEVYSENPLVGFHQNSLNWYVMDEDNITAVTMFPKKDFTFDDDETGVNITNESTNFGKINFDITNTWDKSNSAYIHVALPQYLWYSRYSDYDETGDCSTHPCFKYNYVLNTLDIGINSGDFNGTSIGTDYNATNTKTGVKVFR